jgi:hypothetical protein
MRGSARDKEGEINLIEQKLKDILPALPKEKNKDGTANREYILALLNRLNLIALSGLETGNLPMGYDALQRGLLRQAELNGFDPKHIADSRTAEEKALDVLERLSEEPSEIFGAMDEELDALEKSIQMLSDEIGIPMEILGGDLQLDGITKNQSFGLEEQDKPAEAVLRTILAKSDSGGRLVYIIRNRDGVVSIEISTKAAAAKRGDTLPPGM